MGRAVGGWDSSARNVSWGWGGAEERRGLRTCDAMANDASEFALPRGEATAPPSWPPPPSLIQLGGGGIAAPPLLCQCPTPPSRNSRNSDVVEILRTRELRQIEAEFQAFFLKKCPISMCCQDKMSQTPTSTLSTSEPGRDFDHQSSRGSEAGRDGLEGQASRIPHRRERGETSRSQGSNGDGAWRSCTGAVLVDIARTHSHPRGSGFRPHRLSAAALS